MPVHTINWLGPSSKIIDKFTLRLNYNMDTKEITIHSKSCHFYVCIPCLARTITMTLTRMGPIT